MKMLLQQRDGFDLRIYFPQGKLTKYVQGIWVANYDSNNILLRHLKANASNSIVYCLSGSVLLGDEKRSAGVYLCPTASQAQKIAFYPNTRVVGICFQPGGMAQLSPLAQPNEITPAQSIESEKHDTWDALLHLSCYSQNPQALLTLLYRKLLPLCELAQGFDPVMIKALSRCKQPLLLQNVVRELPIGQRQLARLFKQSLGITAKQYQRIARVNNTIDYLKKVPKCSLTQLAYDFGYSDQAYMTREFKYFTHHIPSYYCQEMA
ncbi:helix-turn-helix domain-containing protein [Pseudoalteromonas sp. MMG012]|uniref:helix-turn-helix domain-containing protein n=1 Tax=Pseudoalteromonas sp. MMG012 TaxID=2822686 RepID=UPI001B3A0777|nr:helix-turn-helix domain-containing protein [Pseudoalteromonas sp. MMG012]MBQ4849850.1 AraC family transcriptional regulator [Pseudoalteromonas sp. MMG012]